MSDNPFETDPPEEQRIREEAYRLWEADGCVHGRDLEYWERARELIAMREHPDAGQLPNPMQEGGIGPGVTIEGAEIQDNLGEFPGLTDQGEQRETPLPVHTKRSREEEAG